MNTRLPIPKKNLDFDKEKADTWIENEKDLEIKSIKAKIIKNIHHVNFSDFKIKSEIVTKEALQYLKKNRENYALFFDYKPHSSKRWVYELNKKFYIKNPPFEKGHFTPTWEKISGNKRLNNLVQNDINTFLIIDDAAYSGEQIAHRQVEPIIKFYEDSKINEEPKFVLAIPFVTNRFLKLIEDLRNQRGYEIILYSSSIMLKLEEILSVKEVMFLQNKRDGHLEFIDKEPTYLNATVTYFDHRVADEHSFSTEVKRALDIKVPKTYSDENSEYFKKEEQEFENYKNKIFPYKKYRESLF